MHKLSAKLPDGQVRESQPINDDLDSYNDLHKLADSYSISLNGSIVYEIDHLTVYVQGV